MGFELGPVGDRHVVPLPGKYCGPAVSARALSQRREGPRDVRTFIVRVTISSHPFSRRSLLRFV